MSMSVRCYLTAGVSVLAAGIITIPPSVPPQAPAAAAASQRSVQVTPRIDLAASVRPIIINPPSPQQFAAVAAIERIDPSAREAAIQAAAPTAAPAPLNAASDWIISGYQFIQYWVDYGVQLTDYVLGFIPYGYLIADQINIFYYNLIRPIADRVVYGLIDPVVNDPLNLASYVNGFINVGQTTINAAINTGIAEFNYFFGWLIPPLPPLPLPFAAATTPQPVEEQAAAPMAASLASASETVSEPESVTESETVAAPTTPPVEKRQVIATADTPETTEATQVPAVETPASAAAATATEVEEVVVPKPESPKTTTSANGVQAQGEVRGGSAGADSPATNKTPDGKTTDGKTKDTGTTNLESAAGKTADVKRAAPVKSTGPSTKGDDGDGKTNADNHGGKNGQKDGGRNG